MLAILFHTSDRYSREGGTTGFRSAKEEFTNVRDRRNLYSVMKEAAYQTYLVGYYHPYRRMFGEELDYCYTAPAPQGNGDQRDIAGAVARHLRFGLA